MAELLELVNEVHARLVSEGRDPESYHNLGIARDLRRGADWTSALLMNRWI